MKFGGIMKQALCRLWTSLFPDTPVERVLHAFNLIWEHYDEELRDYHSIDHVVSSLESLGLYFPHAPREVELAIWLHDVIYIPGDSRSEEMSAHFAAYVLAYLDEPAENITTVHRAIRGTKLHIASTPIEQVVCDIDLLPLALPADEYRANTQRIRSEYRAYSEDHWKTGRLAFIDQFLARDTIYQTEEISTWFERLAQCNLKSEKDRLLRADGGPSQ